MRKKLYAALQKDISRRAFWVLVGLGVLAKLLLAQAQCVYTWIDGAPLDDELMFHAAQSVTAGQWLGDYTWLTLSKHMLFPVWLSLLHALRVPYLAGGQLLWCAAALAAAMAFAPVLRRYKSRLLLFLLLAFEPASTASFTLRVYRDNIFPAECMLFFAGLIGCALRWQRPLASRRPLRGGLPWLLLCGLGLAAAWLTREDGVWLLPFWLVGGGVLAIRTLAGRDAPPAEQPPVNAPPARGPSGGTAKALRCAALAVPLLVLGAGIQLFCAINQAWYGIYALSDFSSGSFAAAFGAMTRVEHGNWHPLVSVPRDVRERLYETVEELAPLRYWLEEDPEMRNGYFNEALGDYQTGSFYWVLRRAAEKEGVYASASTAERFWQTVADKINALCDSGRLPAARGRRSSTTPPIRPEYLPGVLREGLRGLWYTATFQDCAPCFDTLSIGTEPDLAEWEAYLGCPTNRAAVAGTDRPYYSLRQRLAFGLLRGLRLVYAVLLPPALAAALAVQLRRGWALLRRGPARGGEARRAADARLLWLILAGVLGMALLRCLMIAFVEVASFNIGTYVMYLSTVHPLLVVYAAAGLLTAWGKNGPEASGQKER